MFLATPFIPDTVPMARNARGSSRIVWQQRYEGIAHVAYSGGKAIAGVSGPWSDRYVLIWWDERPAASNPLELFETIEAARRAVEAHAGQAMPAAVVPRQPRASLQRGWWTGFWSRRRDRRIAQLRRDSLDAETDLSGLNFCASR